MAGQIVRADSVAEGDVVASNSGTPRLVVRVRRMSAEHVTIVTDAVNAWEHSMTLTNADVVRRFTEEDPQ